MKKSRLFILIITVILILVGGFFYANVRKNYVAYNSSYTRQQLTPSIDLAEGEKVLNSFVCEKDKLCGIKLLFHINGKIKGKAIGFRLLSETGEVLAENKMKLYKLKSGKFTEIRFNTIENSSNQKYIIELTSDAELGMVKLCTEPDSSKWGFEYQYKVWNLETMLVFDILAMFLVFFIILLQKLFRK